MTHLIRCRARVHLACYNGQPTSTQFGDDLPMSEDGTYLPTQEPTGETGSLVCDVCYIALGQPLREDLEQAIAAARRRPR